MLLFLCWKQFRDARTRGRVGMLACWQLVDKCFLFQLRPSTSCARVRGAATTRSSAPCSAASGEPRAACHVSSVTAACRQVPAVHGGGRLPGAQCAGPPRASGHGGGGLALRHLLQHPDQQVRQRGHPGTHQPPDLCLLELQTKAHTKVTSIVS